jgi:hypothetical protein
MTRTEYSIPLFYLFLKLNLWHTGQVTGWGQVQRVHVRDSGSSPLIKKQLAPGLFLLDLYMQEQSKRGNGFVYMAVVSIAGTLRNDSETVFLKISNQTAWSDFQYLVLDKQAQIPKRKSKRTSLYKPDIPRVDTSPINSAARKY